MALHCAFEMFVGDHDIGLIREAHRILVPGGKLVILPLYTHTHYCAYATPEYYHANHADHDAKRYVRLDTTGIASSRKYDVAHLKSRITDEIERLGMRYRIRVLSNAKALGEGIYMHFILEVEK
jgi:ubiquinone/menaquinone biosynthesis C-methylase UbiE